MSTRDHCTQLRRHLQRRHRQLRGDLEVHAWATICSALVVPTACLAGRYTPTRLRRVAHRVLRANSAPSVQHFVLSDNRKSLVHLESQTDAATYRKCGELAARCAPGDAPGSRSVIQDESQTELRKNLFHSPVHGRHHVVGRPHGRSPQRPRRPDETVAAWPAVTRKPTRGSWIEHGAPLLPTGSGARPLRPARTRYDHASRQEIPARRCKCSS